MENCLQSLRSGQTFLDLSHADISAEDAERLAEEFAENSELACKRLSLNTYSVGDDAGERLCQILSYPSRLTTVELTANALVEAFELKTLSPLGPRSGIVLGNGLRENHVLTHLDLRGNDIGNEGASALAEALVSNHMLTFLNLSFNPLSLGIASLAFSLHRNLSLRELCLQRCGIPRPPLQDLAYAMRWNRGLVRLDLSDNQSLLSVWNDFDDALRSNNTLTSMVVSWPVGRSNKEKKVIKETDQALLRLLARNKALVDKRQTWRGDLSARNDTTWKDELVIRELEVDPTRLVLGSMQMARVPDPVVFSDQAMELCELALFSCGLATLPPDLSRLENLQRLVLTRNNLTELPPEIGDMYMLKELDCSFNKLQVLPMELSRVDQLYRLYLNNNPLNDFPEPLKHMAFLRILDLRAVGLKMLPKRLDFPSLIIFYLQDNELEQLPASIGDLQKINSLSVARNNLQFLPSELRHLKDLIDFDASGNPLDAIPRQIVDRLSDLKVMRHWLKALEEGSESFSEVKLMFTGEGNQGKTSLLVAFLRDMYKQYEAAEQDEHLKKHLNVHSPSALARKLYEKKMNIATDGIDITDWAMNGVTFRSWDFAGQEVYYTTHQFFLSPNAIYLVVFNMLSDDYSRIEYWLRSLDARAKGSPVVIVGTHFDDKRCTNAYWKRVKETLQAKFPARRFHIQDIIPVSCKSGKNIDKLKARLVQIAEDRKMVHLSYPTPYILLIREIKRIREQEGVSYILWDDFKKLAICHNVEEDEVTQVAGFLHQIGELVWFGEERNMLSEYVFINPQWLTDVMATIFSLKHNLARGGRLMARDLGQIWREPLFPPSIHPTLLSLLEKFEVLYTMKPEEGVSEPSYLVPSLLPAERPDFGVLWLPFDSTRQQLDRLYDLEFIPTGFFSRLMARLLYFSVAHRYWRYGIVLQSQTEWALVELDPNTKRLRISVRGTDKVIKLMRVITETVDSLLSCWFKVGVEKAAVCVHCVARRCPEPHIFPVSEIEAAASEGRRFVNCMATMPGGAGARASTVGGGPGGSDMVTASTPVRIDRLMPDVTMADLDQCRIDFENELELGKQLGKGGFGIIYLGSWRGQTVAVKMLMQEAQIDDADKIEAYADFRREVYLMSGLRHPNVVELKGYSIQPYSMVMECIAHGDLYAFLHDPNKELAWPLRIKIMLDISRGMEFLHGLEPPLLHRDLKSPNILLASLDPTSAIVAKVTDFGLSSLMFVNALREATTDRAVGNPTWLAPEYSAGSDVYAFGIMAHEVLTRLHPYEEFDAKFLWQQEDLVKEGKRPSIPEDCPAALAELINRCWADDPASRPTFCECTDYIIEHLVPTLAPNIVTEVPGLPPRGQVSEASVAGGGGGKSKGAGFGVGNGPAAASDRLAVVDGNLFQQLSLDPPNKLQCLLLVGSEVWGGARDGSIYIWSADNARLLAFHPLVHNACITTMALVGSHVWTGSSDGKLFSWHAESLGKDLDVSFIPDIHQHLPAPQSLEGPLFKKGGSKGGRRNWLERHFTLHAAEGLLRYWSKKSDSKPKGEIDLEDAVVHMTESPSRPYCFVLKSKDGRELNVDAGNSEVRSFWLTAINGTVERLLQLRTRRRLQFLRGVDELGEVEHIHVVHYKEAPEPTVWVACQGMAVFVFHPSMKVAHVIRLHSFRSAERSELNRVPFITSTGPVVWLAVGPRLVRLDARNFQLIDVAEGHTELIHGIVQVRNMMWTCAEDKSIRVWARDTAQLQQVVDTAPQSCRVMLRVGGAVWTGSEALVRVWDAKTRTLVKRLPNKHTELVTGLLLIWSRTVWVAAWDSLSIWQ